MLEGMYKELLKPANTKRKSNRKTTRVSFLMPTYGRVAKQPEIIAEAVYWFTRQTCEDKELIILNDAAQQTIVCDVEDVKVVNWPFRVPNLGDKMNLATLLASGEICVPYEDDDISLPERGRQATEMLQGYDYWSPMLWWYCMKGKVPEISGNGHGYTSSAFRRSAMLGNHPPDIAGHDQSAALWAQTHLKCNPKKITNPEYATYCYRWGVSLLHLSGHNDPVHAFQTNDAGKPGTYTIKPKMDRDWEEATQAACC